jgi:hypothetical protein
MAGQKVVQGKLINIQGTITTKALKDAVKRGKVDYQALHKGQMAEYVSLPENYNWSKPTFEGLKVLKNRSTTFVVIGHLIEL